MIPNITHYTLHLPHRLVHSHVVDQHVRGQVFAHAVWHGAGALVVAAVEAGAVAALGAGSREAPGAAHRRVQQQVPV